MFQGLGGKAQCKQQTGLLCGCVAFLTNRARRVMGQIWSLALEGVCVLHGQALEKGPAHLLEKLKAIHACFRACCLSVPPRMGALRGRASCLLCSFSLPSVHGRTWSIPGVRLPCSFSLPSIHPRLHLEHPGCASTLLILPSRHPRLHLPHPECAVNMSCLKERDPRSIVQG